MKKIYILASTLVALLVSPAAFASSEFCADLSQIKFVTEPYRAVILNGVLLASSEPIFASFINAYGIPGSAADLGVAVDRNLRGLFVYSMHGDQFKVCLTGYEIKTRDPKTEWFAENFHVKRIFFATDMKLTRTGY